MSRHARRRAIAQVRGGVSEQLRKVAVLGSPVAVLREMATLFSETVAQQSEAAVPVHEAVGQLRGTAAAMI